MTRIFLFLLIAFLSLVAHGHAQKDRSIVSDDFTNARPQARRRTGHSRKQRIYRLASTPLATPLDKNSLNTLRVGVTLWKVQHVNDGRSTKEIAKRVEADTQFQAGDLLRLSIESPRTGFLYVVDRDWLNDGRSGETNLIFPLRNEDNRLHAGKLIDIPARHRVPFKANPQPNQAGEMLTIIVTSSPLSLPLSNEPLPVSSTQLEGWERMWSGSTERFEMLGGAGQTRTMVEQQAASIKGVRQLTREDPAPQTIYLVAMNSSEGLLFNLLLHYVR
jgi:hypothetical protein